MKILLIKPRYIFLSHHPVQFQGSEKALPLALAYLAAMLEKDGHEIRVADYQMENQRIGAILKKFKRALFTW